MSKRGLEGQKTIVYDQGLSHSCTGPSRLLLLSKKTYVID